MHCDICGKIINQGQSYVDGKTIKGPWANMCENCFGRFGIGLGLGLGQRHYSKESALV